MARTRSYLNRLNGWEQAIAAVEAREEELPHLALRLPKLREFLAVARSLSVQQLSLTASKQDASRRLRQTIRKGETLMDFMRTGAREHFGNSSEILVEFGVQPFRGRPRPEDETPTPPSPETPGPEATEPSPPVPESSK
jgi:hypothetical protein